MTDTTNDRNWTVIQVSLEKHALLKALQDRRNANRWQIWHVSLNEVTDDVLQAGLNALAAQDG